jgi:Pyridoxamine 5'-phosphate oxidase
MALPRTTAQRVADARAILETLHADVWVASASRDGAPHLVPVSFQWDGENVTIAVKADSPTARNILAGGTTRLGFGTTRDVVIIDALLVSCVGVGDAADQLVDNYAAQADWNPRALDDHREYVYVVLRPQRIQVWREANELAGRTVMRSGAWGEYDAGG